jgi:hypothetical protein
MRDQSRAVALALPRPGEDCGRYRKAVHDRQRRCRSFGMVASQPRSRFEFSVRLFVAAELVEEIASNARQQVIALEHRLARRT